MATRKHLPRRRFLQGALGGAVAAVGLPTLDAMFNLEQTALADGNSLPLRYVAWFFGNGFVLDRFEPATTGPGWQLSPHLQPLAGVKDYLNIATGLSNRSKVKITHHEGMTAFSGYTITDVGHGPGIFSNAAGPTLDHRIAEILDDQASLHLGVSKANSPADNGSTLEYLSHRGYGMPNPRINNPSDAWQSMFGVFVEPAPDRELRLSILDAVREDTATLKAELGPRDRVRLDEHLGSIRALEKKLTAVPPACDLPRDPLFENLEPINSEQMVYVNELMADLIVYAFACDLTRVATLLFVEGAAEPKLGGLANASGSWHGASHEPYNWGVGSYFDRGQVYMMERWAYLLERMKDTVELDGTNLLDSSMVLMSSDASDGASHAITRQPMVVAGHGRGHLKYPGVHYQPAPLSPGYQYGTWPSPSSGTLSDVLMAILRGFDPDAEWVGEQPDAYGAGAGSGTPLAAILA